MKVIAISLTILLLTGCSIAAELIPSLQHCREVSYTRVGVDIDLTAKCTAPVG